MGSDGYLPLEGGLGLDMNSMAEVSMLIQMPRHFVCSGKINSRVT